MTVNRAAGTTSDPAHVVARLALGQLSYEGVVALPDGTTYYGDELRPSNGRVGGGVFKFTPTTPWPGGDSITSLDQSPLAAGRVSVLRLASPNRNYNDAGQGTNTGAGRWVPLTTPANPLTFNLANVAIAAGGYTGYYRPEDFELDPGAWADGRIRICWDNTGNDRADQWGETLCLTDSPTTDPAFTGGFEPIVEPFVIGNPELRMPDNLDVQPGTGILYIAMDATTSFDDPARTNDSVWACLPDGADPDVLTDGCLRVMNLKDRRGRVHGHRVPRRRTQLPDQPVASNAGRPPDPRYGGHAAHQRPVGEVGSAGRLDPVLRDTGLEPWTPIRSWPGRIRASATDPPARTELGARPRGRASSCPGDAPGVGPDVGPGRTTAKPGDSPVLCWLPCLAWHTRSGRGSIASSHGWIRSPDRCGGGSASATSSRS